MSRPENICGYVQRAWEFYHAIKYGVQVGGIVLGLGTGGVGAPSMLTTDKFCGESPHPIRYQNPNGNSHMRLDADTEPWPFFEEKFNAVLSNHFFEHASNQEAVLRESLRVVKHGGIVAILQPDMTFSQRGSIDPAILAVIKPSSVSS